MQIATSQGVVGANRLAFEPFADQTRQRGVDLHRVFEGVRRRRGDDAKGETSVGPTVTKVVVTQRVTASSLKGGHRVSRNRNAVLVEQNAFKESVCRRQAQGGNGDRTSGHNDLFGTLEGDRTAMIDPILGRLDLPRAIIQEKTVVSVFICKSNRDRRWVVIEAHKHQYARNTSTRLRPRRVLELAGDGPGSRRQLRVLIGELARTIEGDVWLIAEGSHEAGLDRQDDAIPTFDFCGDLDRVGAGSVGDG